ncbi:MAG: STAS/SEC14 domain-containing protein [Actinomycetota bacterium]
MPWSRNSPTCLRDFEGLTGGAIWEDIKADIKFEVFERLAWKCPAIVTDLDWMRRTMQLLGWIAPGELKLLAPEQLDEAKAWVAA